jgi:hypothetical protein
MFGQDSDSVGEFRSLNVVYHLFRRPKMGRNFSVLVKGVLDPSTAQRGGQMPLKGAGYLTAIYAVADNNGLFLGVPVSLLA